MSKDDFKKIGHMLDNDVARFGVDHYYEGLRKDALRPWKMPEAGKITVSIDDYVLSIEPRRAPPCLRVLLDNGLGKTVEYVPAERMLEAKSQAVTNAAALDGARAYASMMKALARAEGDLARRYRHALEKIAGERDAEGESVWNIARKALHYEPDPKNPVSHLAQGTEARRAETGTGSVHDGPVAEGDASTHQPKD